MRPLDSLDDLPASIGRPAYDRRALRPGIVHIGVGAFHRAHQAVYTDDALAHRFEAWGIVGASLRSRDIAQALARQNGLYSVVTRDRAGDGARVVGAIVEAIAAADDGGRLLSRLADPAIRIVTLAVSEKAYGIHPATGGLDPAHPAVAHDLARPDAPAGAVGYLVEGLARRRRAGVAPFTVLCCDNLPANGRVVRRLVLEMADRRDAGLAAWIEAHGRFPCSMVDRIVPAATDETRARAARLLGRDDALAVEAEAFSQWVIEDDFVSGRPAWEAGGALFVDDVAPYETMKLRLLNGAHTLIAHLGRARGLELVRDVMAEPDAEALVRRLMRAAAATLGPVPGINLDDYCDRLIERFANPAIAHRTLQIAMDGSQKMPLRIFAPAAEALAAGDDGDAFAYVTALWLAHVVRTEALDDPRAGELRRAAANAARTDGLAAPFFAIDGLFPPALAANPAWRGRLDAHLRAILAGRTAGAD